MSMIRHMKCIVYNLEVMGSESCWVELGVRSTSLQVVLQPKIYSQYYFIILTIEKQYFCHIFYASVCECV